MNDGQLIWESYKEILKEDFNQDQFYIRFGDLPKGDYSRVFSFQEPTYEKGVSCFWAKWLEEYQRWMIEDAGEHQLNTFGQVTHRPAYLLKGKEIGYGHDEEPLLEKNSIRVLTKLQANDMYYPDLGGQHLDEHPRLSEPYPEWKDLKQKEKFIKRVLTHYAHHRGTKLYDTYKTELYKVAEEEHKRMREWQRTHMLKSNVSPDRFR